MMERRPSLAAPPCSAPMLSSHTAVGTLRILAIRAASEAGARANARPAFSAQSGLTYIVVPASGLGRRCMPSPAASTAKSNQHARKDWNRLDIVGREYTRFGLERAGAGGTIGCARGRHSAAP